MNLNLSIHFYQNQMIMSDADIDFMNDSLTNNISDSSEYHSISLDIVAPELSNVTTNDNININQCVFNSPQFKVPRMDVNNSKLITNFIRYIFEILLSIGIVNSIKIFPIVALMIYDILYLSIRNLYKPITINDFNENHIHDYNILAETLGIEVSNIHRMIELIIIVFYNTCNYHYNSLINESPNDLRGIIGIIKGIFDF